MEIPIQEKQPREIKGFRLITFNLATLGQILPISLYNMYSYNYYTYVIGLDPLLTAIGVFFGLFMYGIGALVFGFLSDNRSVGKWGKRKPFLLYGLPLAALLIILIWIPPWKCGTGPGESMNFLTAIYFWLVSIGLNLGLSLILAPLLAMIPEQSETEKNRVQIGVVQGIFNVIGTIIGAVLPIILLSNLDDPKDAHWSTDSGKELITQLPIIGGVFSILCVVLVLISFFTIDESFLKDSAVNKQTFRAFYSEIKRPWKHDNGAKFMGIIIGFNMAMRILMTILLPLLTFVLLLEGDFYIIFCVLILPFAIIGFIFWNKMIEKISLQGAFKRSLLLIIVVLLVTPIFLFDFPFLIDFILGVILMGCALFSLVGGFIFPNPLLSNIVDEATILNQQNQIQSSHKISGSYFGMNLFVLNIASALANLILGGIFTGGREEDAFFITIALPIAAILFLVAYLCLKKIQIRQFKSN